MPPKALATDLKLQLSDKIAASVQAVQTLSHGISLEASGVAVAKSAEKLVAKQAVLLHTGQACKQLPETLASMDASYSVCLYALQSFERDLKASSTQDQDVITDARKLFEDGSHAACLTLLAALAHEGCIQPDEYAKQQQIVQIHLYGTQKSWRKVLGLSGSATDRDLKAAYRKTAQQVHPDKTACFGAESAFKLVSQALTELAVANDRRSNAEEEDAQCSSDFWADAFQVDPEPPSKRQRHTSPDNAEDEVWLQQQATPDLRTEIARRQASVLRPLADTPEASLTAHQRQSRLRCARSVLSSRLEEEQQQALMSGGGFMHL